MALSSYSRHRLACAYFYLGPGLAYGVATGRLPALQGQVGAGEADLGMILFCSGLSSFLTLFFAGFLVARFGSRIFVGLGTLVLVLAVSLFGLAASCVQLGALFLLSGLGFGLVDVALNTQSLEIETRFHQSCMSLMHAAYSVGAMLGALGASSFAALGFTPLGNILGLLVPYALPAAWLAGALLPGQRDRARCQKKAQGKGVPPFLILCGLCALMAYAIEGTVADWGSIYLYSAKHASQSTAAMTYFFFGASTVICRLWADRLREAWGDFRIIIAGALVAFAGMSLVLLAPTPAGCFAGYATLGAGLAPVAPAVFSMAGKYPGVSPARASGCVSFLAYSGLLCVPPGMGFLAEHLSLGRALLTVPAGCLLLAFLLWLTKKNAKVSAAHI